MDYCSSKNQAKPNRRATGAGVKPKLSHQTLDTVKSQAGGKSRLCKSSQREGSNRKSGGLRVNKMG